MLISDTIPQLNIQSAKEKSKDYKKGKLYPTDKRRNSNYPLIDLTIYFYYKIDDSKTSLKGKKKLYLYKGTCSRNEISQSSQISCISKINVHNTFSWLDKSMIIYLQRIPILN